MPKAKPSKSNLGLTMTIEAVARELGISRNTAYECARTGQIPTVRLGRRLLVPRAALENMLRGEGGAPPATEAA
jgi:excisionase family DNA binding protein